MALEMALPLYHPPNPRGRVSRHSRVEVSKVFERHIRSKHGYDVDSSGYTGDKIDHRNRNQKSKLICRYENEPEQGIDVW